MPGVVTEIKSFFTLSMQRVIRMGTLKMFGVMGQEIEEIKLR